ncbi:MAG: anaerobic ribonucleoside-triphosphate reductase [Actinomycetota bacterium]|nr:anaerobic ribonucleoside-triphosphate reductase [Actinomycetota bacterium]
MSRKDKSSQPIIYVRTSKDEIEKWDRKKIVEALIRETDIERSLAEKISQEVEEQIISSKLTTVTASLIRELVDTKLVEYGLEEARKKHARLGVPLYDTEQAILYPSKENANIPHNPEASNLVLAEQIKKQFALAKVFSQDVADAHMRGDIHLHDLGYPDRPYSFLGDETVVIKKNGKIHVHSFKQLFENATLKYRENGYESGIIKDALILDKDGWTALKCVLRHKSSKRMLWIRTENGRSVIVTTDHPMIVTLGENFIIKKAEQLKLGDMFHTPSLKFQGNSNQLSLINEFLKVDGVDDLYINKINVPVSGATKVEKFDVSFSELKRIFNEGFTIHNDSDSYLYIRHNTGQNQILSSSLKTKQIKPLYEKAIKNDLYSPITDIKSLTLNEEYVYDLTTESGTFLCNGILVHNCSGQNLEYIKKFGLKLPFWATAKPARHPEVLLEQMIKMSAALQGHFAGAIGWDAVNLFFAPYLVGLSDKEIHQLAQMMIFEFSQQSVARGGQSLAHDEEIFIYDKWENTLTTIPIGEFIDSFFGRNKDNSKESELRNIEEDRYYAISFDRKTGQSRLARIYAVSRHKSRGRLIKIKTGLGQEIKITEDHSVFTFSKEGEAVEISPEQKPQTILTPKEIKLPELYDFGDKIDLLPILYGYTKMNSCYSLYYITRNQAFKVEAIKKVPLKCKLALSKHINSAKKALSVPRFVQLNCEFARLLGYYVSEGHRTSKNNVRVHITAPHKVIKEDVRICTERVFGLKTIDHDEKVLIFGGITHRALFEKLCGKNALSKEIPSIILFGSEKVTKAFLSAYLSGDGWIIKRKIGCSTISRKLASQIWLLYLKIGIIPSIRQRMKNPAKLVIHGRQVKTAYPSIEITIGREAFSKVRFIHQEKEGKRRKNLKKTYDQKGYDYSAIKKVLKSLITGKIPIRKYDLRSNKRSLRFSTILDLYNSVSKILLELEPELKVIESFARLDLFRSTYQAIDDLEIPRRNRRLLLTKLNGGQLPIKSPYLTTTSLIAEDAPKFIKKAMNKLGMPLVMRSSSTWNEGGRNLDVRFLHKNPQTAQHVCNMILTQTKKLQKALEILRRAINLLPVKVKAMEKINYHGFVYDISVEGTENFLTAQGIFAHNTIFSDLNLYWEVPRHFEDVPAIGPGGEYTGKTYRDYLKEAQKFVWALFDVYKEGDAEGKPFFFPKPLLHITSKFFETPGHERFLNHISEVASLKGNTYFVFDRGDTYRINECLTKDTEVLTKNSGTIYYSSIEDVYKIDGDGEGWKNLKNLEVLSMENGLSKFKAAKGILKRYYSGEILDIELEDGSSIKVTPKHPSLVLQNGTISVTHSIELKSGDYMPTTKGSRNGHLNFLKIKSIKREPYSGYVYDFEMADGNNPFFQLPNGIVTHNCCRLAFELDSADLAEAKQPWKMRYSALQNVSINLPRVAYLSRGKEEELLDKITQLMELAAKAHLQKRAFLEKLLRMGEKGPLALLAIELDGEPYLRMHRATHLFGIVGLNELVQTHTGKELHESEEALKFGLKIISHMKLTANKLSKKYGLRFVLEQTPAEHVAYRFATLDMRHFPKEASRLVKGDIDLGEIYYTNSTYLNVGAPIDPTERVTIEGMFHPLIEAGWLSHIWLGEAQPPPESIANFVTKVFKNTHNSQIAFSPEFTSCLNCGKITRGLLDSCIYCGSEDVEGITRITGYFSRTTRWNKGKLGELKDRHRVTL